MHSWFEIGSITDISKIINDLYPIMVNEEKYFGV
jgi:hypothetical protein